VVRIHWTGPLSGLLILHLLHAGAQAQPHGIETRVPNQSLLISLQDPPPTISSSGLYSDMESRTVSPGVIPYGVNAELWSDGAIKERFLALPGSEQIEFSAGDPWRFPPNTVLVKNFYLEFDSGDSTSRDLIETRFLVYDGEADKWNGLSYKWEDDGSDAVLLERDVTESYFVLDPDVEDGIREHEHFFPSRPLCDRCHVQEAGSVLGVNTAQLNGAHDYGEVIDNQLRTLNHIGLFTRDIEAELGDLPRMADPLDETEDLGLRARSYLATNCGHCHRPGVIDKADIDLRFKTPLGQTKALDRIPTLASFGLIDPRIIKSGDGINSSLYNRMLVLDSNRMPPLASELVDRQSADVIRRWIDQIDVSTHVSSENGGPTDFALEPGYPNPFNASTTIRYRVGHTGPVSLIVFNAAGQPIRNLVDGSHAPGSYSARWDGGSDGGQQVASGVYLYRLQAGTHSLERQLIHLK
jgi:uncharacterized repeat protein (TIGR03806 family)